jgi:hypothetical protein
VAIVSKTLKRMSHRGGLSMRDEDLASSAIGVALQLVDAVEAALAETSQSSDESGSLVASDFFEAAASAASVEALKSLLGLPAAISIEVFFKLMAKHLTPDPEVLHRLDSKLDVLLETPIRSGLDVFTRALTMPVTSPEEKKYRNSRLSDAQRSFDDAWAAGKAKNARILLTEWEWQNFQFQLNLLRALCAASRTGGGKEASQLAAPPLTTLGEHADRAEGRAAQHRRAAQEKRSQLKLEQEFGYSREFISHAKARDSLRKLSSFEKLSLSIEEEAALRYPAHLAKIRNDIESEDKAAQVCDSEAQRCRRVREIITAALSVLSAQS